MRPVSLTITPRVHALIRSLLRFALSLACLHATFAQALGLGEMQVQSSLGAPFKATIVVRSEQALYSQCFSLRPASGQTNLGALKGADLEYQANENGGAGTLEISTAKTITDPTLMFILQVECGGTLQREYAALLDLPNATQPPLPARPVAPETQTKSTATSASPATKASSRKRATTRGMRANTLPRQTTAVAPPPAERGEIAAPARKPETEPTTAKPEGTEPEQPSVPPVKTPEATPAKPAPAPIPQTVPNDANVEEGIALPWLIAGGIALLALVLAAVWYSRRQQQPELNPFKKKPPLERTPRATETDADDFPTLTTEPQVSANPQVDLTFDLDNGQADEKPHEVKPSPGHDKVLDLAEIMLSFGQSESAMKALKDFVSDHPDEAIDPWLRLLDLLRRDNRREEFESLSAQLSKTFNVAPLLWETEEGGLKLVDQPNPKASFNSLENFEHIRKHLIANWGTEACKRYLDGLMRDTRRGERRGFPLPIIEEIVLLRNLLALRVNEG